MEDVSSFGHCLDELLKRKAVATEQLADVLGVDRSLVYRWLRDERVPKLNTEYVDVIADFLHLSPTDARRLRAAQVRTLQVFRLNTSRQWASQSEEDRRVASPWITGARRPQGGRRRPTRAQAGTMVVRGREAALRLAIELLERVPRLAIPRSRAILMTSQGKGSFGVELRERVAEWNSKIVQALRRGWEVVYLTRFDHESPRLARQVPRMLELLGVGAFHPRYFVPYGPLSPTYEVLIIPGIVALLGFATEDPGVTDATLVIHDPVQIALLHEHFTLMRAQTEPLFESYANRAPAEFWQALAEAEERAGGRVLVKHDLSLVTEPKAWLCEDSYWARIRRRDGVDIAQWVARQRQRQEAFEVNVKRFPYRDICSIHAIEELVRAGRTTEHGQFQKEHPVPAGVRREHLENTIHVLRTNAKYEIGLVDTADEARPPIVPGQFWEVAGRTRALVHAEVPGERGELVSHDYISAEPTVVSALYNHFDALWGRIAFPRRDKSQVIWWLEQQLELLA